MDGLLTYTLGVFMSFFAIMNPVANTPVFLGLVEGMESKAKKKIAKNASFIAFLIVAAFVIAGKYIFELFGITIPAFKITGGLLIFYVGFEMLMSKKSKVHNNDDSDSSDDNIAVSPLAIPILAGPGTIVTAMNHVTHANFLHIGIVLAVFGLMTFLTYLSFSLSDLIVKRLGASLIAVIAKLMGLILAIIGTGMVTEGIKLSFNL